LDAFGGELKIGATALRSTRSDCWIRQQLIHFCVSALLSEHAIKHESRCDSPRKLT
jgi:hypothetical protein